MSLVLAQQAKRYAHDTTVTDHLPVDLWFSKPAGDTFRRVPYASITDHADKEYVAWRTTHTKVHTDFNLERELDRWIRDTPVEELARLIDETPTGLAADEDTGISIQFTLWQRISMIFYATFPVTVTSEVRINTESLRELAGYGPNDPNQRKMPIVVKRTMLGGTMPDFGIVDLPTAAGKTAWSFSVSFLAVSSHHFPRLVSEHRDKQKGSIVKGTADMRVARMVLVATSGSTFEHFVQTLRRLLPEFRAKEPNAHVVMWHKMSKHYSVEVAADMPNTIVFWIVPVKELNGVLRAHPDISVAVCVTDEFTVDTPKVRSNTSMSPTLKQMILQATPQALERATHGARSLLKEFFGGRLHAPKAISELIYYRNYAEAQVAAEQLTLLNLSTPLFPFRARVRGDLARLVPPALDVHFVKSRRITYTSHLLRSQSDLVPASLVNVIVSVLRPYRPTTESISKFRRAVENRVVSPRELEQHMQQIVSINPDHFDRAHLDRIIERLREFSTCCPICLQDNPQGDFKVFGCCGYCVCDQCFDACARCAFCRTTIPSAIPRADAMLPDEAPEEAPDADDYPACPDLGDVHLKTLLDTHTLATRKQITNLTMTLHCLKHVGARRTLLIIESVGSDASSGYLNHHLMGQQTGFDIVPIDNTLRGKGSQFVAIKRRFDSPNPAPMALLSFCSRYGDGDDRFLVGTDLAFADSIVTVGSIPDKILTQALGRMFRPRASRDNQKPMLMVKIGM